MITQFNDEKNEIKAKFKHLMQIFDDPSLLPEDESEYKEDDEISLNVCFERLEREALSHKRRLDRKLEVLA